MMRIKPFSLKSIISFYLGKEFLYSFAVLFLFFFFIFFINQILFFVPMLISFHFPFLETFFFIIYSLPIAIAISAPFATLVGGLICVGRFSSENELLALESLGISRRRSLIPFVFIGFLLMIFSFFVNDVLLPWGAIQRRHLLHEVGNNLARLFIEPQSVRSFGNLLISMGKEQEDSVEDIIMIDRNTADNQILLAEKLSKKNPQEKQGLFFENISILLFEETLRNEDYYLIQAKNMNYNIDISSILKKGIPGADISYSEMAVLDIIDSLNVEKQRLWDISHSRFLEREEFRRSFSFLYYQFLLELIDARSLEKEWSFYQSNYQNVELAYQQDWINFRMETLLLELQQKFVLPLACILFAFLAFVLGYTNSSRSGWGISLGIGLLICTVYWFVLVVSRVMVFHLENISPVFIVWLPNILVFLTGICLFYIRVWRA